MRMNPRKKMRQCRSARKPRTQEKMEAISSKVDTTDIPQDEEDSISIHAAETQHDRGDNINHAIKNHNKSESHSPPPVLGSCVNLKLV